MGYSNAKQKITYEAYLQMEAISDIRREFYYGEILAMDGGTPIHNILVQNTSQTIRGKIQRKGCQTFTENVRLELEAEGYYVYPDVMLVCITRLSSPVASRFSITNCVSLNLA
ncbi:MAG: Uma2 family endonuclease, partial [Bacteroidota bacterium]